MVFMKKIFILLTAAVMLTACGNSSQISPSATPQPPQITQTPEPEAIVKTEVPPVAAASTEGLTAVSSVDCSLISDDTFETVTLYTSAEKENGRFVWDDHARWVLEITSDTGSAFTLYDTEVSNGSIYFDIVEVSNKTFVLLRNISTAANYTKAFTFEDSKLYETNELDLNEMKNIPINLIFTSTPNYR